MRTSVTLLFLGLLISQLPGTFKGKAHAANLGQDESDLITRTAINICDVVKSEGSTRSVQATGQIKAEVNSLFRRLIDLGASVSGTTEAAQYQGVRQEDLAVALRSVGECRQHVFDRLVEVMFRATVSESASSSARGNTTPYLQPVAGPAPCGRRSDS